MKLIRTQDAAGCTLCHDITQIVRGVTKDARFRKGHIVTQEDIPILLSLGKDHLYVWEADGSLLHEDEAAQLLLSLCETDGMSHSEVKEGKIELRAERDGLLKVDSAGLFRVNSLGEMMIATRHGNTPVRKGDRLAGMRVIPLMISKERMEEAKQAAGNAPLLRLLPYHRKRVGIVATGNEIFYGRIRDTFTPVVEEKLAAFGAVTVAKAVLPDAPEGITEEILRQVREEEADLVLCTGGMSVDPDDRTPLAIRDTGARIVSYGAPVLPGAMFLLAYLQESGRIVPVVGLPGCVMYADRTVFDLLLPRLMADDMVTAPELAALGEGGLCLGCDVCVYPACGFGKGTVL